MPTYADLERRVRDLEDALRVERERTAAEVRRAETAREILKRLVWTVPAPQK